MLTIKIPTKIDGKGAKIYVKRGRKVLGVLGNPPRVEEDGLAVSRWMMSGRDEAKVIEATKDKAETVVFYDSPVTGDRRMKVEHEGQYVCYELFAEPFVWSDGPPHPDHLQLARLDFYTEGVRIRED